MDTQQNQQIEDVARRVILPGLKLIQWHCDRQGDSIRLAVGQPTGDAVLDQLLMECFAGESSPANTSAELPRLTKPRWLIASLRLQPEELPGSRTFFYPLKNRFYLVVEVEIDADESVRVVPSVFCYYQKRVGFRRFTDESATIFQPVHLLDFFLSYIEALEAKQSATQSGITAVVSEAPKPRVEPVQTIAATQPVATPIVQPEPPPVPEDPYKLAADAELKVQAAQQKEVDALLTLLGLRYTFRHLYPGDLERGSEWSRKVMGDRPATEGEYQRAYDALCQQAIGFVRSLQIKSITLMEFANYFDMYYGMTQATCRDNQGDQPYEAAFIAQVQEFGERKDMNHAQANVEQKLRLIVQSIKRQCGPLNYGLREYIGACQIEWRLPTDQMIQAIKKQKVLFDELSWGVLQIIQNAGWLPYSERPKGWSLVACFTQSARLTIRRPTEAVECNTENAEFFEFRFERRFSEDGVRWRAIAVVWVSRESGWTKLRTYKFERYEGT